MSSSSNCRGSASPGELWSGSHLNLNRYSQATVELRVQGKAGYRMTSPHGTFPHGKIKNRIAGAGG